MLYGYNNSAISLTKEYKSLGSEEINSTKLTLSSSVPISPLVANLFLPEIKHSIKRYLARSVFDENHCLSKLGL